MKLFNKQNILEENKIIIDVNKPMQTPRVFLFDCKDEVKTKLENEGFECARGSLGKIVNVPNKNRDDKHFCLANADYPAELHEYDLLVFDLTTPDPIDYNPEHHRRTNYSVDKQYYLLSQYPATSFNSRPLNASILGKIIDEIITKKSIIIIFAEEEYDRDYKFVEVTNYHTSIEKEVTKNIYSFIKYCPIQKNRSGTQIEIVAKNDEINYLLTKYKNDFSYKITFYHPDEWEGNKRIPQKDFVPLMQNSFNEIVSFLKGIENCLLIVLPQMKDKSNFLCELLTNLLPNIYPELFPELNKFGWLSNDEYMLPEIKKMQEQISLLESEHLKSIMHINDKIKTIKNRHNFLYDLLSKSSDELVYSVKEFLIWLGYAENKISIVDEKQNGLLEEDIQVELENGLLIIEVKGIAGTSKDSDCAQISKIKYRRSKERKQFDVFGLYIVNHQRFLPPYKRNNPPFNDVQIKDAENDERGLLTTFILFKLFFWINEGIFDKDEVQKQLLSYGLLEFIPSNSVFLGKPSEVHHNNFVVILKIKNQLINMSSKIIINDGIEYEIASIESIQLDNAFVKEVSEGEIGIKLNKKVSKKAKLWLRNKAI